MNKNKQRIGLFGGTLDPIHKGHIEPAKEVIKSYSLDKLLFIPAHNPPHKNGTKASADHRVKMAELVCKTEKNFELDIREINRSTLSYTIDTLKEITAQYPKSELFFIMGMDSLLDFTTWHRWEEILLHCNLIVNTRPGYDLTTTDAQTKQLLSSNQSAFNKNDLPSVGRIFLHNSTSIDVSSSEIRNNIANNTEYSQWLTSEIIQYIKSHKLYN